MSKSSSRSVGPTHHSEQRNPRSNTPCGSQDSIPEYNNSQIEDFLGIYPTLRTKFSLSSPGRNTALEDLLYAFLQKPPASQSVSQQQLRLLQAGFINISTNKISGLLSRDEKSLVRQALGLDDNPPSHLVANCVTRCFRDCSTYESFSAAFWNFDCTACKHHPRFNQAALAVLQT